jgi:23S rRNA (cytosine1962-C5)-methyltransferase
MSLSARRGFMDDGAGRLVFGEADGLPGLVVDRYGNALVAQLLSAGMDRIRPMLIARLSALCAPDLIVERSDTGSREQEGLPAVRGVLAGRLPDDGLVRFTAGGMSLVADVLEGQKTGFYLDQKDNWAALRPFGKGRRILDVCCYTGAFGLSLMLGGGVSLVGVDSSRRALDLAVEHARLNGMDGRSAFVAGDAGAILAGLAASGERYDFVIVDPSALARTKKHRTLALRAYRALNSAALKATAPGGLLFSCSCTPWVGALELAGIVAGLAREAGRCARLLEVRGQSRDHVAHPLMPETRYLTGTLWHIG